MEASLALSKDDLESEIGEFMGWGRGLTRGMKDWSARQKIEIREILNTGLRTFYYPNADGLSGPPYSWSFLRPTYDGNSLNPVVLAEGEATAKLPEDFGTLEGDITITADQSRWWPLQVTGEATVRAMYALNQDSSGVPQRVALRPIKGTTASRGQRFELWFWPLADQDYTLGMTYNLALNTLTAENPFPYGGTVHAETIKQSCLAAAELIKDKRLGEFNSRFQQRLTASIALDRRNKTAHFGRNSDRSDGIRWPRNSMREVVTATIAGMTPD